MTGLNHARRVSHTYSEPRHFVLTVTATNEAGQSAVKADVIVLGKTRAATYKSLN